MNNEIECIKGNIFKSKHQTLVNTVNCVGVMGAGIALEFKYRYPEMFDKYVKHCKENRIQIGTLWVYKVPKSTLKVLNFPTKNDWKHPSKYEYLERGLKKFVETYREQGITSVAFPMLGALNGGLDPDKVLDLMKKHLSDCDIPIEIYEYDTHASDNLINPFKDAFMFSSVAELQKQTELGEKTVLNIKEILEHQELDNLIHLHKIKGIGQKTVLACFKFAMNLINTPQPFTQDIFSTKSKNVEKLPSKQPPTKVIGNKMEISLEEKRTLTGLDEQTIFRIENKEQEISIGEIRTYCSGLKISLLDFVAKNYFLA